MALVCLVAATAASAQQPRPRFAVGLGLTAPMGDYHADQSGEGFNIGWQGLAVMDYRKPGSPLGFRANAGYGQNGGNDRLNADLTAAVGQPTDAIMKMLGADVDLTYNFRRARQGAGGYLLGGIGAYRATFSVRSGGVTVDTLETKFAWNVGAAFTRPVASTTMFFEVRYCDVSKAFGFSQLASVALTAGLRLGGL